MKQYSLSLVLAASALVCSPAMAGRTPAPLTPAPVAASVLASGTALSGDVSFITFTTGATVASTSTFTVSLGADAFPDATLTLSSAAGTVVSFAQPSPGSLATFAYSGLTAGTQYTFQLSTPLATSWEVATVVDVAAGSTFVTSVPEPSTYLMMAACLGVIGGASRFSRRGANQEKAA
jgi:hypothetical protein